jgi:hypothetical protein
MNKEEYAQWELDASAALSKRYSYNKIMIILKWFRTIKTSKEIELVGLEKLKDVIRLNSGPHFSLYATLMMRVWVYAPYIIEKCKSEEMMEVARSGGYAHLIK